MNLVIDQGNTVTKVAIFKADILLDTFLYKKLDIEVCSSLLTDYNITNCIFSSVIEASPEVLTYLDNNSPYFLFINENTAVPVKNGYRTPKTLGKDRLAAVVGANFLFPDQNILIIDVGTAITYEFVDSSACYQGGNISPGLSMRFKALNAFTGKLPLVDRYGDLPEIGYDTETAIRAGVVRGVVHEIDCYIDEYYAKDPSTKIILTGGHSKYIQFYLKNQVSIDINLVLKGLNRILNYNVKR